MFDIPWTQQPQYPVTINRKLIGKNATVWLSRERNILDLRGQKILGTEGSFNGQTISNGRGYFARGVKWTDVSGSGVDFAVNTPFTSNTAYCALVVAAPVAAADNMIAFSQRDDNSPYYWFNVNFNHDGSGQNSGYIAMHTGISSTTTIAAASQFDGRLHAWGFKNTTVANSGRIFRDGLRQTLSTETNVSGTLIGGTTRFRVGNLADSTSSGFTCTDPLVLVVMWSEDIPDSLLQSLSLNPWQIFEPLENKGLLAAVSAPVSAGAALVKIIDETLNITESTTKVSGIVRSISETVNFSEATNKLIGIVRNVNETLNISESVNTVKGLVRSIDEVVNFSESVNSVKGIINVVNETLQISESVNKAKGIVRTINETINFTEVQNRLQNLSRSINETVNFSEVPTKAMTLVRAINEALNIEEVINPVRSMVRTVNETVQYVESVNKAKAMVRVINEVVNYAESVINLVIFVPPLTTILSTVKCRILRTTLKAKPVRKSTKVKSFG